MNIRFINIDEAYDGTEACEKSKNTSYDIIFMDDYMPNLNGNEATKKIIK
jgi:YesN/AraC family two-component response regulator